MRGASPPPPAPPPLRKHQRPNRGTAAPRCFLYLSVLILVPLRAPALLVRYVLGACTQTRCHVRWGLCGVHGEGTMAGALRAIWDPQINRHQAQQPMGGGGTSFPGGGAMGSALGRVGA